MYLGTLFLIFVNRITVGLQYMLLLLVVLGAARVEGNSRAKGVPQSLLDESRIHSSTLLSSYLTCRYISCTTDLDILIVGLQGDNSDLRRRCSLYRTCTTYIN